MRVKVHPLFLIFILLYTLLAGVGNLCAVLLALLIHEAAHLKALDIKGYKKGTLALSPFGAVIYTEEKLGNKDIPFVALAGPLSNLLTAIGLTALWWIAPAAYPITHSIARSNLILGLTNLLPALPLDGGQALTALFEGRKTEKICRLGNVFISIIFLVLFMFSCMEKQYNFSLLIFGAFLLIYPITERNVGKIYVFRKKKKDKVYPIEISEKTTLAEMLKIANRPDSVLFTVLDEKGKSIGTIKENQLLSLAGLNASATAKQCLKALSQRRLCQ